MYFYSCLVSHTTPRFYLATVEKKLVRVRVRVNMGVAGNEATFFTSVVCCHIEVLLLSLLYMHALPMLFVWIFAQPIQLIVHMNGCISRLVCSGDTQFACLISVEFSKLLVIIASQVSKCHALNRLLYSPLTWVVPGVDVLQYSCVCTYPEWSIHFVMTWKKGLMWHPGS